MLIYFTYMYLHQRKFTTLKIQHLHIHRYTVVHSLPCQDQRLSVSIFAITMTSILSRLKKTGRCGGF